MSFLSAWSWWLLELVQLLVSTVGALGIFGRGAKRDQLVVVGAVLTWLVLGAQWLIHGTVAVLVAAIAYYVLVRSAGKRVVLRFLAGRGVVHPNPDVATDIVHAQTLRERRQEQFTKVMRERGGLEALRGTQTGSQDEATRREQALQVLIRLPVFHAYDMGADDIVDLVNKIQMFLGPVQTRTILTIATWPKVLESYQRYKSSERKDDAELLYVIQFGQR